MSDESSPRVSAVVADDEPLAREAVVSALAADGRVDVIRECRGGADAIEAIRTLRPDVAFLDIHMPEVDGFDVLTALGEAAPLVVMVTAYDDHAVRAFDHCAVDYILKPIDPERFRVAIDRVMRRTAIGGEGSAAGQRFAQALAGGSADEAERGASSRLMLRTPRSLVLLDRSDVTYVESAGNYVRVHAVGATHLVRGTTSALADRLGEADFVRVHRSFVVHLAHVREVLAADANGDGEVVVSGGERVPVSRARRRELIERLAARVD